MLQPVAHNSTPNNTTSNFIHNNDIINIRPHNGQLETRSTSKDGIYHVIDGDDGDDDGDDDDVNDVDDREDIEKEDATNNTITSEQDDAIELHDNLAETDEDNVNEHSA